MSQTVDFDPNTAPLEELEAYLSQPVEGSQQDDAVADAPEDDDGIEYFDMDEKPEQSAAAEPVQEEPAPVTYTQKQLEEAQNRRAKEVRESIHKSEEYRIYKDVIARRAKAENISQKEAAKRFREEYISAEAERLGKDPKALAETVLRSQMPQDPEPEEAPEQEATHAEAPDARVKALAEAVRDAMQQGRLPRDFNVNECLEIFPDFFADAERYGEAAAVRSAELAYRFAAKQATARRVEEMRSAPRSIAPRSQPAPAPRGLADMSDDEFAEFDRKIERYANAGKHVRI